MATFDFGKVAGGVVFADRGLEFLIFGLKIPEKNLGTRFFILRSKNTDSFQEMVPLSQVKELKAKVRELERLLGKKRLTWL